MKRLRVELGFAYRNAGSTRRLLKRIATFLTINPKSIDAHYFIGWIRNKSGDYPGGD